MKTPTENVKECIRQYLSEKQITFNIVENHNYLTIVFSQIPAENVLTDLKQLVFFSNEMEFPNLNDIFSVQSYRVRINLKNYDVFYNVYNMLKSFSLFIQCADIDNSALYFRYKLQNRHWLLSNELDLLQNIVNPKITEHDSIRIVGFNGIYSMNIWLNK